MEVIFQKHLEFIVSWLQDELSKVENFYLDQEMIKDELAEIIEGEQKYFEETLTVEDADLEEEILAYQELDDEEEPKELGSSSEPPEEGSVCELDDLDISPIFERKLDVDYYCSIDPLLFYLGAEIHILKYKIPSFYKEILSSLLEIYCEQYFYLEDPFVNGVVK